MDFLSVIYSGLTVINDVKGFAQSAGQAKRRRDEIQTEVSSITSMLNELQNIVKGPERGHRDDNGPDNAASSAGSSSEVQGLQGLDDIKDKLQNLQKAVEDVRAQLISLNNLPKMTLRNRLYRAFHPSKEHDKIEALLTVLRSIQDSTSWLTRIIPM